MLYVELVARGAAYDLHSSLAPIVTNPAWRLVWALQTLKAPDETILIPGWYDQVRPPSPTDLDALHRLPNQEQGLLAEFGLSTFLGEVHGVDLWQRLLFAPTCTICGIIAGYTGAGSKTVLPAEARVKLDFRLVPDMEPVLLLTLLRTYLDRQGFTDIEIINHGGVYPARSDLASPIVQATAAAAHAVYGTAPNIYPTMAGTGPWYTLCQQFGIPACSGAGCGYSGERIHSPNENIREQDYWLAMHWMGHVIKNF
jgi:acetylornithine deacetylase/succinyl-diaminopimelate desuccinylase-like protein